MAQQYIFQMQGLTKTFPGGKKIFENIWLSFYNDAKIGVVGVNGSGKSTLLKIMAGLDKEFSGEAKAADKRARIDVDSIVDGLKASGKKAVLVLERSDQMAMTLL